MKVLMLGWEYPPHIAGGLGTACEGLTQGLARQSVDILFVMPRVVGDEDAGHMLLMQPSSFSHNPAVYSASAAGNPSTAPGGSVTRLGIPAFLMPYWTAEEYVHKFRLSRKSGSSGEVSTDFPGIPAGVALASQRAQYGKDIFEEVAIFARGVVDLAEPLTFDLIHAHDWMTYPAGVALKEATGRPLVVHVHSLEFDRSGSHVNPGIDQIERYGITRADVVIAVSHYTKQVVCREHGIPPEKVHVVHNGIYPKQAITHYKSERKQNSRRRVLFLGRVTFQKGPDYFVRAAAKVVPYVKNVVFVVAGSGDMLEQIQRLARELQIEEHFLFPGFLRGESVEEAFLTSDLYVMPSVSEPFGISALEAISFDVPVLLSRQSGVAEVVDHSLKFDFWDVDRLADLIINGLEHEELRADMVEMARKELGKLRWDASASRTVDVYKSVLN